jgi:glutamate N-acetyltransferase/amino-acid N-acetyltransferase
LKRGAPIVPGMRAAGVHCGIKHADLDLALLLSDTPASVAGVFTRSTVVGAPVELCRERVRRGTARAIAVNSGISNVAMGKRGLRDAESMAAAAARSLGVAAEDVLVASTGVIGEPLPMRKIRAGVAQAAAVLAPGGLPAAARAIMTTDTVAKVLSREITIDGVSVTVTGMAKGAGMMKPDMATMLAFVCCDAKVATDCLDSLTREVADGSFNRITVDGDTSTNDAFIVVATGQAEHALVTDPASSQAQVLKAVLLEVSRELAQGIVRDAEGATKFVTIRVGGGRDESECLQVAYTVAESPLVKTALFASDPNWGRFAMAIGRAGIPDLDSSRVDVYFDSVPVMVAGVMAPDYSEEAGAEILARDEFTVRIDLSRGEAQTVLWTSDLSYDYVRINSEYRT